MKKKKKTVAQSTRKKKKGRFINDMWAWGEKKRKENKKKGGITFSR